MSAFTEANRKAFKRLPSDLSNTYNAHEWQRNLTAQVSNALISRKDWLGAQWIKPNATSSATNYKQREVRLLDYACGTGAITQALGPYVTSIRGIDISENMVELYNRAASSSGLTSAQAHAMVGNLLVEDVHDGLQGAEWRDFDIAVVAAGLHHMEDPALAMQRLAERLKPETGVLVVIDFLPFTHSRSHARSHSDEHTTTNVADMSHTIKHHGFAREDMAKLYADAGLEGFGWDVLPEPAVMEFKDGRAERTIFVAKGTRAPTTWGKLRNWMGGLQDQVGGQMRV